MKRLIKNGNIINVFTGEIEKANILLDGPKIAGVGAYDEKDADMCIDVGGKYIAPGFIDGHIHIESTMLSPRELAKVCILHGTTTIVADPHEIANVCGKTGIEYMLHESHGLPLNIYIMLPSCVPATSFDETGATLQAEDLEEFYKDPRVLGLGEMMNYPGVLLDDEEVIKKIHNAKEKGLIVNGHAPLLGGRDLDKYIFAEIRDDHECSNMEEAKERIRKGQWVMIREGSFAKNLVDLIDLFDEPYAHRCILVTDDKNPEDLTTTGHIDHMIRMASWHGKSSIRAVQMATIQAADCLGIKNKGAVAPGYDADIVVFEDLENIQISDVFIGGERVLENGKVTEFSKVNEKFSQMDKLMNSVHIKELSAKDFHISDKKELCRVIQTIPSQLLTYEQIMKIDFENNKGFDLENDILKIAVVERHLETGHIGLGLISGIGIKKGAIASTVAHDAHNLVIVGTNDEDMAVAGNFMKEMGGGYVAVLDGRIVGSVPLEIAGLMSTKTAWEVALEHKELLQALSALGVEANYNPFTSIGFVCLPVIPNIKITTKGIVDVNKQELVSLFGEYK